MRAWHYSRRPYSKSVLHMGVEIGGRLCGVLAWGPGIDTRHSIAIVPGTPWDGYLELNRMALSPAAPRCSESRALAVAVRLLRAHAPWLRWLVSYADGCQSGSGTIYRAAGWALTQERRNTTLMRAPDGRVISDVGLRTSAALRRSVAGAQLEPMRGYMRRYMLGLDAASRAAIAGMTIAGTPEGGETAPPSRAFEPTCPLYLPTQTGERADLRAVIATMPRYSDQHGATSRVAAMERAERRAEPMPWRQKDQ